jgi:hypothetical protein
MHVDDRAGVVRDCVRDTAVPKEQIDQVWQQGRLADPYVQRHQASIIERF